MQSLYRSSFVSLGLGFDLALSLSFSYFTHFTIACCSITNWYLARIEIKRVAEYDHPVRFENVTVSLCNAMFYCEILVHSCIVIKAMGSYYLPIGSRLDEVL